MKAWLALAAISIGTLVSEAESWPSQLVARLPDLKLVGNLGVAQYARWVDAILPVARELLLPSPNR